MSLSFFDTKVDTGETMALFIDQAYHSIKDLHVFSPCLCFMLVCLGMQLRVVSAGWFYFSVSISVLTKLHNTSLKKHDFAEDQRY